MAKASTPTQAIDARRGEEEKERESRRKSKRKKQGAEPFGHLVRDHTVSYGGLVLETLPPT